MEVYPYHGVGLCFTRQARRPLQSCDCQSFLSFATLSVNFPTSNKLFWSLIALAPHSYDYKIGRMKKMKNREKCEKCEDFIHWDNHLIFLPYDFLALLPFAFCLLIHLALNVLTRHCKRNLPQNSHAAAFHQASAYRQAAHL